MTLTFSVTLSCASCKAELRFLDERPAWKTYDYRVEEADECERSARFVAENVDEFGGDREFGDWWMQVNQDQLVPPHVWAMTRQNADGVRTHLLELGIPDPYRYIDCPVCDAKIREPKQRPY